MLVESIEIKGLPKNIDETYTKAIWLLFGRVLAFKHNNELEIMRFSSGGKQNKNYVDKDFKVVNPWYLDGRSLSFNENNAVILYSNNTSYVYNRDIGFYNDILLYADIISNIDKSLLAIAKNSRVLAFIDCPDSATYESVEKAIKRIDNGESLLKVKGSIVDKIQVNPISKSEKQIIDLIQLRQYYIAEFKAKCGIADNVNMKKERNNCEETEIQQKQSSGNIEKTVEIMNRSCEKLNKMFETKIEVIIKKSETEKEVKKENDDNTVKPPDNGT